MNFQKTRLSLYDKDYETQITQASLASLVVLRQHRPCARPSLRYLGLERTKRTNTKSSPADSKQIKAYPLIGFFCCKLR